MGVPVKAGVAPATSKTPATRIRVVGHIFSIAQDTLIVRLASFEPLFWDPPGLEALSYNVGVAFHIMAPALS